MSNIIFEYDKITGEYIRTIFDGVETANSTELEIPVGMVKPLFKNGKWVDNESKKSIIKSLKNEKRLALLLAHEDAMNAGVIYNGSLFQSNIDSISAASEVLTAISSGWVIPDLFEWIDAANTPHAADLSFMNGLFGAMMDNKSLLFKKLYDAKMMLKVALTESEVRSVNF